MIYLYAYLCVCVIISVFAYVFISVLLSTFVFLYFFSGMLCMQWYLCVHICVWVCNVYVSSCQKWVHHCINSIMWVHRKAIVISNIMGEYATTGKRSSTTQDKHVRTILAKYSIGGVSKKTKVKKGNMFHTQKQDPLCFWQYLDRNTFLHCLFHGEFLRSTSWRLGQKNGHLTWMCLIKRSLTFSNSNFSDQCPNILHLCLYLCMYFHLYLYMYFYWFLYIFILIALLSLPAFSLL